jgi:hypothetical protein
VSVLDVVAPLVVGVVYVVLASLVPEPARQRFNAVVLAGAGAAYLSSGGVGLWELAFTAAVTACAFLGLRSYPWLGVGWLLHTGWDVVHHQLGAEILPTLPGSSFGCAICDPVIALWLILGAPSVVDLVRGRPRPDAPVT